MTMFNFEAKRHLPREGERRATPEQVERAVVEADQRLKVKGR
ncbi:hypothetical protein SNOG_12104 [Parastagonospora nodorum SN15]|uniref:Uncharacterized protein n=1 Tax=Phaeosphaeria nodorum (strain SN15 / ATCC MYA-4574 / FGSC 10173) TaxID=321614 RepID=Q0U810_PHANO|nr:hypothetical protein SNOG_12104 [Parastagonospora nodorum SN15]EAT80516.1 hypothetical protein SNOG_12104 [Parastagonospora nodorum SN15]